MLNKFLRISKTISVFLVAVTVVVCCIFPAFAVTNTTYNLKNIGMTLEIPSNMQTITRDSAKDDKAFAKLGLEYSDTMENFKTGDIYLQSFNTKQMFLLTVTMTTTKESKEVENYKNLTADEMAQVKKGFTENSSYTSAEEVEINGYKYLRLMMQTSSDGQAVQSQQYNTVVNGNNYVIMLQAANGEKLRSSQKKLLLQVMNTVTITKPAFFYTYGKTIIICVSVVLGIALIILLIILIKRFTDPQRKNRDLIHQLAHEHKITETTQIPRKKLQRYMLETAPEIEDDFMQEYAPLGEPQLQKEKVEIVEPEVEADEDEPVSSDTIRFRVTTHSAVKTANPVHNHSDEPTIIRKPVEAEEAEVVEGSKIKGTSYFTDIPGKREMYVYSDVSTAVEDYKLAKKVEQRRKRREREQAGYKENPVLKVLRAVGKALGSFFMAVGMFLVYLVVHIRYFSINLYRLIKRKRAEKKRRKIVEERRRNEEERLRMRREAEMRRRQRNSQRGENDLIQVRSRTDGRTYPRSGSYDRNRSYNRNYDRNRRR